MKTYNCSSDARRFAGSLARGACSLRMTWGVALVCVMACALLFSGCSKQDAAINSASSANTSTDQVVIGTLATEDILPMWVAESEGAFAEGAASASASTAGENGTNAADESSTNAANESSTNAANTSTGGGANVRVETFQSATELIAAVTSGSVQLAMTDPMVAASIHASGTPVQIEWVTLGTTAAQGRFGIMTADDSITSLQQLAGVPVGVGSNTILEYVMDTLMTRAGVAPEDIEKEELQKLPVRYQAVASGQVKAAALPASLLALGEANGMRVLADDTQGENISQSVMIANSAFANTEAGAAAIDRVKQAWNKCSAEINAAPENYRALLASKANLSSDISSTYKLSEYPQAQLPEAQQIDNVLNWMREKGYLAQNLTYNAESGTFSAK